MLSLSAWDSALATSFFLFLFFWLWLGQDNFLRELRELNLSSLSINQSFLGHFLESRVQILSSQGWSLKILDWVIFRTPLVDLFLRNFSFRTQIRFITNDDKWKRNSAIFSVDLILEPLLPSVKLFERGFWSQVEYQSATVRATVKRLT